MFKKISEKVMLSLLFLAACTIGTKAMQPNMKFIPTPTHKTHQEKVEFIDELLKKNRNSENINKLCSLCKELLKIYKFFAGQDSDKENKKCRYNYSSEDIFKSYLEKKDALDNIHEKINKIKKTILSYFKDYLQNKQYDTDKNFYEIISYNIKDKEPFVFGEKIRDTIKEDLDLAEIYKIETLKVYTKEEREKIKALIDKLDLVATYQVHIQKKIKQLFEREF